ncbi:MAG: hypothetical protein IT576_06070 [Verrucomicrobiales bacterium]|nr:hypothetical protein [Verrucomicrobiales bacterium]
MIIKLAYAGCEPRKSFEPVLLRTLEGFKDSLPAEEVRVRVAATEGQSPPYGLRAQFVTPGPDYVAEGRDHTLPAALRKLVLDLLRVIRQRTDKQVRRKDKRKTGAARGVKSSYRG